MPELPEVETLRRDLLPVVVGRRFTSVSATGVRSVRRSTPSNFEAALTGALVIGIDRHGKYLLVRLAGGGLGAAGVPDDSSRTLVMHLRMSGQVLLAPSGSTGVDEPLHTHVRLGLDDSTQLWFVDPRTFGELWVTPGVGRPAELAHLGPDAWVDGLPPWPRTRRVGVKGVLLDQGYVAGIGNIYADEICHRAGVRVDRSAAQLTRPAFARLHSATADVLDEAVTARGSTLGDGQYVDLLGRVGGFGLRHRVHARAGQPCLGCGKAIDRLVVAGRSAYQCRSCQR